MPTWVQLIALFSLVYVCLALDGIAKRLDRLSNSAFNAARELEKLNEKIDEIDSRWWSRDDSEDDEI